MSNIKRFLLFAAFAALAVITVVFIKKADTDTKKIAGFMDSNVFFEFDNDNDRTTLTILNQKIRLR